MENITNLISLFIGFATVMLLLSMVVTGLAQTLSNGIGVRWRSGRVAVVQFLVEDFKLKREEAITCADQIYRLPLLDQTKPWWHVTWQRLRRLRNDRAPRELGWDEIKPAIQTHLKAAGQDVDQIEVAKFDRLRARISDDYSHSMKVVSFIVAFVVAFCFQVSATKLVRDLSTSDALRTKALELGQAQLNSQQVASVSVPFSAQAEKALSEVREKFPDSAGALEQVSGVSDTTQEWVTELRQILKGDPSADGVVSTFQGSLERQANERSKAAEDARQAAQASLSALDIRFIEDLCFYHHAPHCGPAPVGQKVGILWGNIAGVLMTGILLTFGAPFWYDKLKDLNIFQNQLRSVLKTESKVLPGTVTSDGAAPAALPAKRRDRGALENEEPSSDPQLTSAQPKPAE